MKFRSSAIVNYDITHRHPDRERLLVSSVYKMRTAPSHDEVRLYVWPQSWPLTDRCGVYIFLDDSHHVLYVGKAGPNRTIGQRLTDYFRNKQGATARFYRTDWSPAAVVTVAAPRDSAFEAASLETFLIGSMQPTKNTSK